MAVTNCTVAEAAATTAATLRERMNCIDRSLLRLSQSNTVFLQVDDTIAADHDNHDTIFSDHPYGWNHQNNCSNDTKNNKHPWVPTTASSASLNDITTRYSPMTLEKQFQDLYRLLHPALISKAILTTTSNCNNNPTEEIRQCNASAFLQGTRGSGKSYLLHQVLRAIRDEIVYHHHHHHHSLSTTTIVSSATQIISPPPPAAAAMFRTIYINGLLIPGHSVHHVVREILNQLSYSAFHHHIRKVVIILIMTLIVHTICTVRTTNHQQQQQQRRHHHHHHRG
jgi:Cdc6-like AAA superfamily ATPase